MVSKIKPLMPSLREKKRYLVFEVISKDKAIGFDNVEEAIISAGLKLIGELGMAKAGVILLKDKWDKDSGRGMLRINNKYVDHIKAAFTFIEQIDGKDVIVRSLGISGIMKKAQEKYLKNKQ